MMVHVESAICVKQCSIAGGDLACFVPYIKFVDRGFSPI